jgi:predicted transposase YbfD/YdcC
VEQVFKLERTFTRVKEGKGMHEVVYGVTRLTAHQAGPTRLLELVRKHWEVENQLHYRRDDTLREDRCTLRTGHAAAMMAAINNLVLGILRHRGVTNVPDARRHFQRYPEEALTLVVRRL